MALFFLSFIKRGSMTIDDFKILNDHQKVQVIFDANKITEKVDNEANYQLFQIDNFFVETRTSLEGKFKRSIRTFTLKELPIDYAGEVVAMPIVKSGNETEVNAYSPLQLKKAGIENVLRAFLLFLCIN
jgi:hypothetical protein